MPPLFARFFDVWSDRNNIRQSSVGPGAADPTLRGMGPPISGAEIVGDQPTMENYPKCKWASMAAFSEPAPDQVSDNRTDRFPFLPRHALDRVQFLARQPDDQVGASLRHAAILARWITVRKKAMNRHHVFC